MKKIRTAIAFSLFLGACLVLQLSACTKNRDAEVKGVATKTTDAASRQALRKYALESAGDQACGIYYQNTKVGYLITHAKISSADGKDFFEVQLITHLKLTKDNRELESSSTETKVYSLQENGALERAERQEENDGAIKTFSLTKSKSGYILSERNSNEIKKTEGPDAFINLGQEIEMKNWLNSSLTKPGDKIEHKGADFSHGKWVESTTTYEFVDRSAIMMHGIPKVIFSLSGTDETDSSKTRIVVDTNGTLIRGDIGIFTFRLEDIATAKDISKNGVDIVEISRVPINMAMGAPEKLSSVVMRVHGLSSAPPDSRRQTLMSKGKDGSFAFEIRQDEIKPESKPLNKFEKTKYLSDTPSLQIHADEIRLAAAQAIGQEKDATEQAKLLMKFVGKHLSGRAAGEASNAVQVLKNADGDCTEHTLLFQSLARSVGIPTREVTGMSFVELPEPTYYWHTWNEIHNGRTWISIDSTWDEFLVDAAHFELEREGETDKNMMNSVGKMQIEILSFERNSGAKTPAQKNDLAEKLQSAPKATAGKPIPKRNKHENKRKKDEGAKNLETKRPIIIEEFRGSQLNEVQVEPLPPTRKPHHNN